MIVGPDGSGKKTVVHSVIEGRKMVIFIDLKVTNTKQDYITNNFSILKRCPVINGEELVTS